MARVTPGGGKGSLLGMGRKIQTSRILIKLNLLQKERKIFQNLSCDKITYLKKYTLTVQFSI